MTRNRKLILAGVTAAAIGLAGAGAFAARGGDWGHGWGGGHGWRHSGGGMGAFGFGGPGGKFCRGSGEELAEHMMVRLEYKVKPTEAQKAPFEELKTAAKTAAQKVQAACPAKATDEGTPRPRLSPIERLVRTQTQLEAQLDAIKIVRPAAEKFYASLSDDQKAKLNQPRWGGGKRGEGRRGGDDAAPKQDAPAPQPE